MVVLIEVVVVVRVVLEQVQHPYTQLSHTQLPWVLAVLVALLALMTTQAVVA